MTDNEIIKALGCCSSKQNRSCGICPAYDLGNFCASELKQNAIDLINSQKTENENLKVENQSLRSAANSLKMHYEEAQAEIENYKYLDVILHTAIDVTANIKSEAVKEFAERLKERIYNGGVHPTVEDEFMCDIDEILKELVGDDNA